MKFRFSMLTTALALSGACTAALSAGELDSATRGWTYSHAASGGFLAEIVGFDGSTGTLWVAGVTGVDVRTEPGVVRLYDTQTRGLLVGTHSISVGALPDMLSFTPDGSRLLVANEGTPLTYGALSSAPGVYPRAYGAAAVDPAGSVTLIDMALRSVAATATLAGVAQSGSHIRTQTGMDFEPETIAVNAAGTKAYVSLQEANAMGVLDIASGRFDKVVGLGAKDFSAAGNRVDPLNNGNKTGTSGYNLIAADAKGLLYMPDGMATFSAAGQTFVLMANEGDFREDDGDRTVAGSAGLNATAPLNNLRVSNADSSAGSDITKRVAAIAVFDVTDPSQSSFVRMLKTDGDMAPEGLMAYALDGQFYLAYSNEVSSTTTVYQLAAVPEPGTVALMLAGLAALGAASHRQRKR